jgi:hypothetical protein
MFADPDSDVLLESFVDRIETWLAASPFAESFQRLCALRLEDTAEWIFQTEEYINWTRGKVNALTIVHMPNLLWVRGEVARAIDKYSELTVPGHPGTGKSVLAASVVHELITTRSQVAQEQRLTTYFFFEYDADNGQPVSRDHAYRAILSQLFHQLVNDSNILDVFSFAFSTTRSHSQRTATTSQLLDIIKTVAARINQWYIIIDAIDECREADDLLLELYKALGGGKTNILLFSRPNVRFLREKTDASQIVTVSRLNNEEDLRIYFDTHLQRLQDLHVLPQSAPIEQLVVQLLTGADGMFQWARLMIIHLQSDGLSPWQRLNVITALATPEQLDTMYIRILKLLSNKLVSEQELARRILVWVAFGKRPLAADQLQDILTPPMSSDDQPLNKLCQRPDERSLTNLEHSAIMVSGGLIERRWSPHTGAMIYTFVHGSVRDFFRTRCAASEAASNSKPGNMDYFLPAIFEVEAELAFVCLSYLLHEVPAGPLSGNMFEAASPANLNNLRPFLSYAALNWPFHLLSMQNLGITMPLQKLKGFTHNMETTTSALSGLMLRKLMPMVWVELVYTFEKQSSNHSALHHVLAGWAGWALGLKAQGLVEDTSGVVGAMIEFSEDLVKLHRLWGDTLLQGPHHIWNDTTAFTSSSLFTNTNAVTVTPLICITDIAAELSSAPLLRISRDDPNTDLMAVLAIWPSR